jgi:antirestriction protein ArdC
MGTEMARKAKTTNKAIKRDLYQIITDKFLDALAGGSVPWHNPVKLGNWPANLITQKRYRGVNVLMTQAEAINNEFTSRWWLTYKQATELGGQVRKGEKSTKIVYWLFKEHVDANGKKIKRGFPLYSSVFNSEQVDGIEDKVKAANDKNAPLEFEPLDEAERIMADYKDAPRVLDGGYHGEGAGAYVPSQDKILMPNREQFESVEDYYTTLFHEAGHSTGHGKRLNREGWDKPNFGSEPYSFEELVAEMTAAFLCGHSGIDGVFDNSANYIAGWLDKLGGESKWVMKAASKAQAAVDHILGVTWDEAPKDDSDDDSASQDA